MITRIVVPAIMASILLGTSAMAAMIQAHSTYSPMTAPAGHNQLAPTMTAAQRCAALESQFDSVIKSHESSAKSERSQDHAQRGRPALSEPRPHAGNRQA